MSKYKLSPSELEFIEFFWNSTEGKCKQDVVDFFSSSGKDGSTISFFLSKSKFRASEFFFLVKAVQKRIFDSQAGGAELFLYTGVLKAAV